MTLIQERIETVLPIDEAFDYIADFANAHAWDPGTISSRRIDSGPVGAGALYLLDVRMGDRVVRMDYRIRDLERPNRVVLTGSGPNVHAVDDIRFERTDNGTRIDYTADIRLGGLLRFVQPFLGGSFEKLGRDAAAGMHRRLDRLAAQRGGAPR